LAIVWSNMLLECVQFARNKNGETFYKSLSRARACKISAAMLAELSQASWLCGVLRPRCAGI
jgi:hypothetical protein